MRLTDLLAALADRAEHVRPDAVALVAIDGVDAAGKTTLARELSSAIRDRGRPVVEVSIDAFHHPAAIRYHRGRDSGEGYYRDSFDLAIVHKHVDFEEDPQPEGNSN